MDPRPVVVVTAAAAAVSNSKDTRCRAVCGLSCLQRNGPARSPTNFRKICSCDFVSAPIALGAGKPDRPPDPLTHRASVGLAGGEALGGCMTRCAARRSDVAHGCAESIYETGNRG